MSEPISETRLPLKKIIGLVGVALILTGYFFLAIDPDTSLALTIARAFIGMGMVGAGAILSVGAFLFIK